jgi:hypothetical protein
MVVIALIVTGLAMATSAWSIGSREEATAACCCSGESCPMKKKGVSATKTTATGHKATCCKDDSCPMKNKDASANDAATSCDKCECCKADSCPMKKSEHHEMTDPKMKHAEKHDGKTSCCACCEKHKDGKKPSDAVVDIASYQR